MEGTPNMRKRTILTVAAAASAVAATSALAAGPAFSPVAAQTKALGSSPANVLSPGYTNVAVAKGAMAIENPTGLAGFYGYLADGKPFVPATAGGPEAQKTEPDKNTYLVLRGAKGADPKYDYGTHFLFQGHEAGLSYITRINLDADVAHRVTYLGDTGANASLDGSSWNPFARKLLVTGETTGAAIGGVWQLGTNPGTKVERLDAIGYGGYEGVQTDNDGNVWLVSDIGGSKGTVNTKARQPNSFVYRFVPSHRGDLLAGGELQALQVLDGAGAPIFFDPTTPDANITSAIVASLHTYGTSFKTRWVTVHDTATSTAPFDANAAAKAAKATAFKRPENGVFRPDTDFRQFFFTETGDTDLKSQANGAQGGYGGIFKLTQRDPSASTGRLRIFFNGDAEHTGLDNISFLTRNTLIAGEDAGDTVHTQRAALDSIFAFHVGHGVPTPVRFLGEGRDPSATIDSARADAATPGHTNDGDNETTGIHVSDGDASIHGLAGTDAPEPFDGREWRVFWTQQHGDNTTWEIVASHTDRRHR
jgi:hypothetical protein